MAKASYPQAGGVGLLCIRLFLGGFFLYSGLNMVRQSAAFINVVRTETAGTGAYVAGNKITFFADILTQTVHPNATLVAWLVMGGLLALGALLVVGLLTRLAAFFALLMLLAFLLATMHLPGHVGGLEIGPYLLLGLNGGCLAMALACLITGAGRTLGLDHFLARRTGGGILW